MNSNCQKESISLSQRQNKSLEKEFIHRVALKQIYKHNQVLKWLWVFFSNSINIRNIDLGYKQRIGIKLYHDEHHVIELTDLRLLPCSKTNQL